MTGAPAPPGSALLAARTIEKTELKESVHRIVDPNATSDRVDINWTEGNVSVAILLSTFWCVQLPEQETDRIGYRKCSLVLPCPIRVPREAEGECVSHGRGNGACTEIVVFVIVRSKVYATPAE
jgi:hypothetical protein